MPTAEEQRYLRKKRMERHGRQLTVITVLCALLVLIATLEVLMFANAEGFRRWQSLNPEGTSSEYSAVLLANYLIDILLPVGLALYTYFSIARLGTPKTYRIVWGAIVFLSLVRKILTMRTQSVFWYLAIVLMGLLFFAVINIHRMERTAST